jgi:thiol-disulfide isomerase/thioredoxin
MKGDMMHRARYLVLVFLLCLGVARAADEPIYDEKADASQQIAAALAAASQQGKPARNIVLVFGANWCPDCHALDDSMHKAELAALLEKEFAVVKIDVGRMDKNLDVARKYGVPIRRGIPALAVLDSKGKVLYAMDQGQFADARHLTYESIKAFYEQWKPKP